MMNLSIDQQQTWIQHEPVELGEASKAAGDHNVSTYSATAAEVDAQRFELAAFPDDASDLARKIE